MSRNVDIYDAGEETRYELVEEHEGGAEGRLWRAWQVGAGGRRLPVAVKVLTPERYFGALVDKEAVLTTWREQAQVMRSFSHDGFVPVQVVFRVADPPGGAAPEWMVGLPAFVTTWAAGADLLEWSRGVDDVERRIDVLRRCAAGLDAFHRETEHVHRDVKPENVVVVGERARLVDYGLVRSFHQQRRLSTLAGTAGYLAPELEDGAPYTAATDRYAFAALIFHQLTLHHPPATRRGWQEQGRTMLAAAGADRVASPLLLALHPDPQSRLHTDGVEDLLDRIAGGLRHAPVAVSPRPVSPSARPRSVAEQDARTGPPAGASSSLKRAALLGAVAFVMTLLFVVLAVSLTS